MTIKLNPFTHRLDLIGTGIAPGDILTITPDAGGAVGGDGTGNINLVGGAGATTNGNPGTNTITVTASGGGITWTEVVGITQAMGIDTAYVANNAALVTLTLPATAIFGSIVKVQGKGLGLFKIAQNALQTVHYGDQDTTTGIGGSLDAENQYDSISIVCIVENTDWAIYSSVGNFTVN